MKYTGDGYGNLIEGDYRRNFERTSLCSKMLQNISDQITTFRPSESLHNLRSMVMDEGEEAEPVEIDVVLSGGGLKGYFMAGCSQVLRSELAKQNITIGRVAGTSAGSWAGLFLITDFATEDWLETFFLCQSVPELTLLEAYESIWPAVNALLPVDAYKICTDRLFISVTEITWHGVRNVMISKYSCNRDLFEACCASSMIPHLTHKKFYWDLKFANMYCLDGGITNNTPVFTDGDNRQLVFRLYEVEYPWRNMINALDTCIETLSLCGGLLMSRFFQGETMDSITWLEKKRTKKDLYIRPGYPLRMAVLPVLVGGLIIGRTTGLSSFLRSVFKANKGDYITPFNRAGAMHGSGASYISAIFFSSFVDLLRGIGALF